APTIAGAADWASGQIKEQGEEKFLRQSEGYLTGKHNQAGLKLLEQYRAALHNNFSDASMAYAKEGLIAELTKTAGQSISGKDIGGLAGLSLGGHTIPNPITTKPAPVWQDPLTAGIGGTDYNAPGADLFE